MLGTRRPAWTVLLPTVVVGSVAAAILLVSAATRRRLGRGSARALLFEDDSPETFTILRRDILGRGKRRIISLLGPPRTTKPGDSGTWYYAINNRDRLALAISFDHGRARRIEFVQSPAQNRGA